MPIPIACLHHGCNKPVLARRLCKSHYGKWARRTDERAFVRAQNGSGERFLLEVARHHTTNDCLIWPYGCSGTGYGRLTFNGRRRSAHNAVCELVHGPAPSPKHEAAHSCGNRKCVNPQHLRWDTRAGNHADKLIHGTHSRGERAANAKLSRLDVLKIKAAKGTATQCQIARNFRISEQTVSSIYHGRRWAWLD